MRVLSASVKNFASYKRLDFDFTKNGLALISGPTGAGKSTLCDVIPWIVFGRTAKGGAVDEVRSWNSVEPTEGRIHINLGEFTVTITRVRGTTKDNDLYFYGDTLEEQRGKDLNDTQKLINDLLGIDAETYISGTYFHEFSQIAQFFTTNAKNRRSITEQMADLTLANKLAQASSEHKKQVKIAKDDAQQDYVNTNYKLSLLNQNIEIEANKFKKWEFNRTQKLKELEVENSTFETVKQANIAKMTIYNAVKLKTMEYDSQRLETQLVSDLDFEYAKAALDKREAACQEAKCSECGALKDSTKRLMITKDRYALENRIKDNERVKINILALKQQYERQQASLPTLIALEESRQNTAAVLIEALKQQSNPHSTQVLCVDRNKIREDLADWRKAVDDLSIELSDIELLLQVNDDFRAICIKNTIEGLERSTNKLLREYFDAELTVKFETGESDKLDVTLMKDGNLASYTQLSKGQRGLLKLCFGVSVMKAVSNHNGVNFSSLFFDEALDGLSEALKLQAFRLFQSLESEYESIFVIDHSSELKTAFLNRYEVTLIDGESQLEKSI